MENGAQEQPAQTVDTMLAVAQKEMELRQFQCKAEIEATLKKFGMSLRVGPPPVEIVPLTVQAPVVQPATEQ